MRLTRWLNPSLPQTLQIAVFLFYIDAFFGLLSGSALSVLLAVGALAAGLGIANEQRWGYALGLVVATVGLLPYVLVVANDGIDGAFGFSFLFSLIFPVALFVALVHPLSRSHQRIWFH